MSEPVFFLSRFRIKEGQLTAVRQMMSEAMARLHAEKPRTLLFLSYLDSDGGTISFLHAFADAESMDLHFVGADERSQAAYQYLEPLGWEVYGHPSPTALETLRQAADSAGVPLAPHPEYLAGFLRLEPSSQRS
jgi:quinol monooxygenase YgiN